MAVVNSHLEVVRLLLDKSTNKEAATEVSTMQLGKCHAAGECTR